MVGTRIGWLASLVAGLLLAGTGLRAQTVIWVGPNNGNFETPGNYSGGVAPDPAGDNTVQYNSGSGSTIVVSNAANIYGITIPTTDTYYSLNAAGGGTLTIGAGGIAVTGDGQPILFFNVPIILSANQTWNGANGGYIYESGGISGGSALTLEGRLYAVGSSTYSGGTEVTAGATVYVGNSNAFGTGLVTLDDTATLTSWSGSGQFVVPNAVSINGSAILGADAPADTLGFSGTVTEQSTGATLTISQASVVAFNGPLAGPANSALTIAGSGAVAAADGGSQAVLSSVTGVNTLNINQTQVILNPTVAANAAFPTIGNSNLTIQNGGYLGLSGTFTATGAVSTFLYDINAVGSTINGSIGLDSYGTGTTNTFNDAIDLSPFSSANFLGLGSATSAILYGTVSQSGSSGDYKFGGGGGTLILVSSLNDSGVNLLMTNAPAPLTLELRGNNNSYSGDTESYGGVLIFDAPILTANGLYRMNGGYIGYVPSASNKTTAQFISLFDPSFQNGVIGFDNDNSTTVQVTDPIDLSGIANGTVFLGTSTSAELSGILTAGPSGFGFTGVKGGTLQVDSDLGGASALTIGLSAPIEANGSVSTVILTGDNSMLTGPVTFNSGILEVALGGALGNGQVTVPDNISNTYAPLSPVLEEQGENVTLANNFSINNIQADKPGLVLGNPAGEATLTLSGVISDGSSGQGVLGIQGNVALTGANTYSGTSYNNGNFFGSGTYATYGTILDGPNNPVVYVNNAASFGNSAAGVLLNQNASIVPEANVNLPNVINVNNSQLTLGQGGNDYTLTLSGQLIGSTSSGLTINSSVALPNANPNFGGSVDIEDAVVTIGNELSLGTGSLTVNGGQVQYGFTDPTIENLAGDENASVNLAPSSTLTLDATNPSTNYFFGTINGDANAAVVKTGAGAEYLGNSGSTWGAGTTVEAGTLIAGLSTALGTGPITVNGGATLATDSPATLTNTLYLQSGSTLGGVGTFAPAATITLSNGIAVQPGSFAFGNGVGTLSIGSSGLTLGAGGIYNFNIATAGGSAGTDYGTLAVAGTVDILASSEAPFTISLVSVSPSTGQAGLASFNSGQFYSWTILTASQINYFNAADFTFSTASFQNGLGAGYLTIAQSGNSLVLDFSPVPEPATWALLGGGTLLAGWVTIRRRRRT